jgi:hypothetical protein
VVKKKWKNSRRDEGPLLRRINVDEMLDGIRK